MDFLKSLFTKKYYTGVNKDTRSIAEQLKDWLHEERAFATTIKYTTKEEADKQKIYQIYNQLATSSCVGNATATEVTIYLKNKYNLDFKGLALFIYRLRSNYSGEGMIPQNSNDIAKKYGVPSHSIYPTVSTESAANQMVLTLEMYDDAKKRKVGNYFAFKDRTWENIMAVVSNGTTVKICIDATINEWKKEWVTPTDKVKHGYAPVSHAIVCLPNTVFEKDGEQWVLIQDSAWFGGIYYRYVSKSFFDANRCYYASYITDLDYSVPTEAKPRYRFTKPLKYGDISDDVKALQDILIYEKLLPKDCNTGKFYGLTLKAVKSFQMKYSADILIPLSLKEPTGNVGYKTIEKLNSLYA